MGHRLSFFCFVRHGYLFFIWVLAIDIVPQSLCQQEGLISLNSQRAILNVEKKSSGFSQLCNRQKLTFGNL
jgi:hypothetical protein